MGQGVERYAEDQQLFFDDFTKAWWKMQELGYSNLRPLPLLSPRYWVAHTTCV